MKLPKYEILIFDYKEDPVVVAKAMLSKINKLLRNNLTYKIYTYDHPICNGSDMYGFIMSTIPLSRAQIKEITNE